jgi:hypothetical protein
MMSSEIFDGVGVMFGLGCLIVLIVLVGLAHLVGDGEGECGLQ